MSLTSACTTEGRNSVEMTRLSSYGPSSGEKRRKCNCTRGGGVGDDEEGPAEDEEEAESGIKGARGMVNGDAAFVGAAVALRIRLRGISCCTVTDRTVNGVSGSPEAEEE